MVREECRDRQLFGQYIVFRESNIKDTSLEVGMKVRGVMMVVNCSVLG